MVGVGNELLVFGHCIVDDTDVSIVGYTAIRTAETTSCRRPEGVRTMRQFQTVTAVGILKYCIASLVGTPHILTTVDRVSRKHVPEGAYAIVGHIRGIEIRISKVETHILNAHDYTTTAISLREICAFINTVDIKMSCHVVIVQQHASTRLYPMYAPVLRQRFYSCHRYVDYIYIVNLGELLSIVCRKQTVDIVFCLNKSTECGFSKSLALDIMAL